MPWLLVCNASSFAGSLAAAWQHARADARSRSRSREMIQAGVRVAMAKALQEVRGLGEGALVCVCGSDQLLVETEASLRDPWDR